MNVSQTAPHGAPTNQLIPFDFEEHPVRVVLDEHGAPWFNAGDVCRVLGYANPRDAVATHVDPEDVGKRDTLTSGGVQQANYINESGLYALIFGSTKPEAKRFKRWVTGEVLPTIRKTGGYGTDRTILESMEGVVEQLQRIADEIRRPAKVRPPSRAELKAKYDRCGTMAFHQAIQPIHMEYGQPWTTSLAIAHACGLRHQMFLEKIQEMAACRLLLPAEYCQLRIDPPDSGGGLIYGFQLSETGLMKLAGYLDFHMDDEIRATIRDGADVLKQAFTSMGQHRTVAKPKAGDVKLAATMADLGSAVSRLATMVGNQGGRNHG